MSNRIPKEFHSEKLWNDCPICSKELICNSNGLSCGQHSTSDHIYELFFTTRDDNNLHLSKEKITYFAEDSSYIDMMIVRAAPRDLWKDTSEFLNNGFDGAHVYKGSNNYRLKTWNLDNRSLLIPVEQSNRIYNKQVINRLLILS